MAESHSPRTGANAYVLYGYEGSYGGGATTTKSFGAKTSVGGLTLSHSRIDLNKLGQIETSDYAYGNQTGSVSINYVLTDTVTSAGAESSGDIFRAIYGAPSSGYYPANLGEGTAPTTQDTITIDVGFNTSQDDTTPLGNGTVDYHVRTLKGCILNSLSISTAIGDVVNCSADFSFGDEDLPTKVFTAPTISHGTPYTFANAALNVWDNTISPAALTALSLVQDAEVTFTNNSELLYGLGSHQAVSNFRKILDVTGKFKVPMTDYRTLERILAQIGKGTGGATAQTISGVTESGGGHGIELSLTFTNGTKSIQITMTGVSITDFAVSGLEPVEVVYQEVSFKAKAARIFVDTTA